MEIERWQQLKDAVGTVLEHERREWPARLVHKCGHDVDLFFEASGLLATSSAVGDFIEKPAWNVFLRSRLARNPASRRTAP